LEAFETWICGARGERQLRTIEEILHMMRKRIIDNPKQTEEISGSHF